MSILIPSSYNAACSLRMQPRQIALLDRALSRTVITEKKKPAFQLAMPSMEVWEITGLVLRYRGHPCVHYHV